jgi:hypothetical protein
MPEEIPLKLHPIQDIWIEQMKSRIVQCSKCKKSMRAIHSKIRFYHRRSGGMGVWYFCEKHYNNDRSSQV